MAEEKQIHGNTRKAAEMALAKRSISRASYDAIIEGRIGLDEAKSLGRGGTPFGPAPKTISKDDRSEPCMCGCGKRPKRPGSRWIPGHDARAVRWANAVVRGEDTELTDEQRQYIESSGKLAKAQEKLARDDQKRQEKIAAKAEKQREREGGAEAKKRNEK